MPIACREDGYAEKTPHGRVLQKFEVGCHGTLPRPWQPQRSVGKGLRSKLSRGALLCKRDSDLRPIG